MYNKQNLPCLLKEKLGFSVRIKTKNQGKLKIFHACVYTCVGICYQVVNREKIFGLYAKIPTISLKILK